MEIIMNIEVCLISQMNFDHKEHARKKALLANSKHQYHVSECGEHYYHAKNKKNGYYYKYPSLSHFTDEL